MIPCPYCDREFEKRAGLMRHVTASHHSEGAIPVNAGGALEAVVPVEPETYAESLDGLAEGQAPYVDPPTEDWGVVLEAPAGVVYGSTGHTIVTTPVRLAMDGGSTTEEYRRIRALIREGHSEQVAWMTVLGTAPPAREAPPEDGRPLRLQQVAFRVRNTEIDQIDASWLLHLAEIGAEAIAWLAEVEQFDSNAAHPQAIVDRWNEAIR